MTHDPRRLIARLAVAVMVADGRITCAEHDALERLDELGLGPLSDLAEEEIQRAVDQPIDLGETCAGLANASPEAATVIVALLAEIAASDRSLSPEELDVVSTVATLLGLGPDESLRILSAAAAEYGVRLPPETEPRAPVHGARRERVTVIHDRDDDGPGVQPVGADALARAYSLLGIDTAAGRGGIDAAYLELIERYNPAKVVGLGMEFVALAVHKLAEVTAAFETVRDAQRGVM